MPDPALHTERLTLRPLTARSAAALLAGGGAADGEAGGPAAPGGFPRPDDLQVLHAAVASGEHASGSFVLEQDGTPIGTLGVAGPVSPDGDQELGYGLVPTARGRGLATEAVGALCAYLEQGDGVRRLTAEVLPGNEPSLRLLHRLGFVDVGRGAGQHRLLARAVPGAPGPTSPTRPPRIAGRHVC